MKPCPSSPPQHPGIAGCRHHRRPGSLQDTVSGTLFVFLSALSWLQRSTSGGEVMVNVEANIVAEHFFLPRSLEHLFFHPVAPKLDHYRSGLCLQTVGFRCQCSVCSLNSELPVTGKVECAFQQVIQKTNHIGALFIP